MPQVAERAVKLILLLKIFQSQAESAHVVDIQASAMESSWPERESPFVSPIVTGLWAVHEKLLKRLESWLSDDSKLISSVLRAYDDDPLGFGINPYELGLFVSIINEGYVLHDSGFFGAALNSSSIFCWLQVAIFANSHSLILSNGRKSVDFCIHQSSRACEIYQARLFGIFPSTSKYPLTRSSGGIPFASRISFTARSLDMKVEFGFSILE
jgi:hypothetical protein